MKDKGDHRLAFISVILAAIFGGGFGSAAKIGLHVIPPLTFTFFRFFIATLLLLPFILKEKPRINKNTWKVAGISLLGTINVSLFAYGVRLTTATISQLLYTIVPLIAAFLSYLLLNEKITTKKIIGILIGFTGGLFIVLLPSLDKHSHIEGNIIGNVIILVAVVAFSIYTVFSKKYQLAFQISPLFLTFIFTSFTTVVLAFFAVHEFVLNPSWVSHLSTASILAVLYVGVFGGTVYYVLYQYAIKHGTPVIASMTLFLQPMATFLWASILLGETLTPGILFGGALAFLGAYIATLKK